MQNEAKNQEDFKEIFGFTKTMAAAIAACFFSLRETHFRWQHHYFWKIFGIKGSRIFQNSFSAE